MNVGKFTDGLRDCQCFKTDARTVQWLWQSHPRRAQEGILVDEVALTEIELRTLWGSPLSNIPPLIHRHGLINIVSTIQQVLHAGSYMQVYLRWTHVWTKAKYVRRWYTSIMPLLSASQADNLFYGGYFAYTNMNGIQLYYFSFRSHFNWFYIEFRWDKQEFISPGFTLPLGAHN